MTRICDASRPLVLALTAQSQQLAFAVSAFAFESRLISLHERQLGLDIHNFSSKADGAFSAKEWLKSSCKSCVARDQGLLEPLYYQLSDQSRILHQPEGLKANVCLILVLSNPLCCYLTCCSSDVLRPVPSRTCCASLTPPVSQTTTTNPDLHHTFDRCRQH